MPSMPMRNLAAEIRRAPRAISGTTVIADLCPLRSSIDDQRFARAHHHDLLQIVETIGSVRAVIDAMISPGLDAGLLG